MNDNLEEKLFQRFHWLEARNVWSGEKLGYCFPMEFFDGWYQLIYDMCEEIEEHYKRNEADVNEIQIYQIKEKYGSLRFYCGNVINGVFDIVEKYENKSEGVCEVCGSPGRIRIKGAWLKSLCQECRDKFGYRDCEEYYETEFYREGKYINN